MKPDALRVATRDGGNAFCVRLTRDLVRISG